MVRVIQRAIALLFLFLLVLPGLPMQVFSGSEAPALRENRKLATPPDVEGPWSALPAQLSDWVADHFPGRNNMISQANRTRFALGMEPNHLGMIGGDGWLYITRKNLPDQARGADPLTRLETARLLAHFESMQATWNDQGVPWIHLLAPGKSSAIPQHLPPRVKLVGPSRAKHFQDSLNRSTLTAPDLFALLEAGATGAESMYYRTDSHWNCLAAIRVYRSLMAGLPRYKALTRSDVTISRVNYSGDISRSLFGLGDAVAESAPRCQLAATDLQAVNYDQPNKPVNYPPRHQFDQLQTVKVSNPVALNSARVAVIRDSFFWSVAPFVDRTFAEVLYIYHWGLSDHRELLQRFGPDVVVYQYTDRALHDTVEQWRAASRN